ncbi:hypothetical protein TrVFT333_007749 [Trichoderma virens FT-333]|nr:hypothetical protein TrVFT333_007749 [Trichoderma virens FT-333]
MKRLIARDQKVNGEDAVWDELGFILCDRVIPSLLGPLTNIESIRPVLVHGNLYKELCWLKAASGEAIALGAAAFWAPKEYDFALRESEGSCDPFVICGYSDIDAVRCLSRARFNGRLELYRIRELCIQIATILVKRYGAVFNGYDQDKNWKARKVRV